MKFSLFLPIFAIFILIGCSTKEVASVKKLSKNERVYFGNVFVKFNEQNNKDARCELFLSSSISAEFKTSESGFVSFTTTSKKPRLSEIACIYNQGREKFWVYYPIPVESIKRPQTKDDVVYFGDLHIEWVIEKEDIDHSEYNKTFAADKKISGKGEFKIEVKDNSQTASALFAKAYPDLSTAKIQNQILAVEHDED